MKKKKIGMKNAETHSPIHFGKLIRCLSWLTNQQNEALILSWWWKFDDLFQNTNKLKVPILLAEMQRHIIQNRPGLFPFKSKYSNCKTTDMFDIFEMKSSASK